MIVFCKYRRLIKVQLDSDQVEPTSLLKKSQSLFLKVFIWMRFLHAAIVPSVIFILNKVLVFFCHELLRIKLIMFILNKISINDVHPKQGDPTKGNSASLLQQAQPSEQHGAQVTKKNQVWFL